MSRFLIALLLLATTLRAVERIEIRPKGELLEHPGRVIVELQSGATLEQFRRDVGELDRRAGKRGFRSIRHEYRRVLFGAAVEVEAESLDALRRLPYVRAIHPDRVMKICAVDAAATAEAAARVRATALSTRGEGITVGIIDTGVDYLHPALGGGFGAGRKVAGGWDFVANHADPMDYHGHGTHVAGIVAADSAELTGVAPGATLYAYRALDATGRGWSADIIAAIERSIDPNQDGDPSDHLDVINLSLGSLGTADDLPSRAVDRATAAGVVVVVAAGNEEQFATVRSPGTARTAITVGALDNTGAVTSFSSRGPSPHHLDVKPDIAAPGFGIVSARLGGGLIALNGTSMAAPHVAGAAALLLKLHPEWTPADVKSAIITSAEDVGGAIVGRGAGRVDAEAAASRTAFVDGPGVSFGLAPAKTGTTSIARTVKLTNRGAEAQSFEVVATGLPAGMTLVASPPSLQLAPGASQSVELTLHVDNANVPFPADLVHGGNVEFRGAETLKLPWLVLRAARLTVQFEGGARVVFALSSAGDVVQPLLYDIDRGEIFGSPERKWDVFAGSYEFGHQGTGNPSALYLVTTENRDLAGDELLTVRRPEATVQLSFGARDASGNHLGRRALDIWFAGYYLILGLDYAKGAHRRELTFFFGDTAEIYLSPLSSSFTLYPVEMYVHPVEGETYNLHHKPVHGGISESRTFTMDRSDYSHARLLFNDQNRQDYLWSACATYGMKTDEPLVALHGLFCFADYFSRSMYVDYYTTPEYGVGSGFMFVTPDAILPPMRGVEGATVAAEFIGSPATYRIADGEGIVVGRQALAPIDFYGTIGGGWNRWVRPGFTGPLGDWQATATLGTAWTLYDEHGEKVVGGTIDALPAVGAPLPVPRGRFVAVREGLRVGTHVSRGELEVRYPEPGVTDYVAPTFTSMRIVDANGRIADPVHVFSTAAIEFSAADFQYVENVRTKPMKPEATRVWYRRTGTHDWSPAQVVITGSDNGSLYDLKHVPAGELYRADLSAATNVFGPVDLRLEIEDADGNRTSWTQSPALVVGAPRRRPSRN